MKLNATIILAAGAMFALNAAQAADIAAGAEKAKTVCAACHGPDGNGTSNFPDYPKLAGQTRDYLEVALKGYKAGTRKNAVMAPMAQALSAKDIENVAAFYASQSGPLHVRR